MHVNADNPIEDVEQLFLQSFDLQMLVGSLEIDAVWQWTHDLISRRFNDTVLIAAASPTSGKRSKRVGSAILVRMAELDFAESDEDVLKFQEQYDAYEKKPSST